MSTLRVVRFRSGESPELMAQAWRLRHRVFRESLGWEVASVDLLEFDRFDRQAWHCAVVLGDRLVGYWRALCTVDPYLLELSFPALLEGRPVPKSSSIWEISRFAILPESTNQRGIGRLLVRDMAAFGHDMGATELIAVTEPAFERFVLRCGLPITRTAGPLHVGQGRQGDIHAVLISLELNSYTLASVGIAAEAA